MRATEAEFLEPVSNPQKGAGMSGMIQKYRGDGPLEMVSWGPGWVLQAEGCPFAVIIPWTNVRFAKVSREELAQAGAAKKP